MKSLLILLVIISQMIAQSSDIPLYKDSQMNVESRVMDLLSKMTLEEKWV